LFLSSGIVPDADAARLRELGVARVFTPKDFEMSRVLDQVVDAIREAHELARGDSEGAS